MNTRDIPEKSFFSANYGINFIQGSAFKPYTTYAGGKTDFLGFDDGTRALPKDFASYDSVSYTHLDVYKRQHQSFDSAHQYLWLDRFCDIIIGTYLKAGNL